MALITYGLGILSMFSVLTVVYAQDPTTFVPPPDTSADLEKKIPPEELERIKKEAEKLREGKPPGELPAALPEKVEQPRPAVEGKVEKQPSADEQPSSGTETRDRGISQYKTLRQGFYPREQITQQPIEQLTQSPIRSPTITPERKTLPPFKGFK